MQPLAQEGLARERSLPGGLTHPEAQRQAAIGLHQGTHHVVLLIRDPALLDLIADLQGLQEVAQGLHQELDQVAVVLSDHLLAQAEALRDLQVQDQALVLLAHQVEVLLLEEAEVQGRHIE